MQMSWWEPLLYIIKKKVNKNTFIYQIKKVILKVQWAIYHKNEGRPCLVAISGIPATQDAEIRRNAFENRPQQKTQDPSWKK
jgi:hypothetical protein